MLRRFLLASILILLLTSGCVISPRRGTGSTTGGSTGGKLYVATAGSILRFGNALTASGNVAPEATFTNQVSSPRRILVDATNDRLFVAQSSGSVLVFSGASTATNTVTPAAVLTSSGNMVSPFDVAIDPGANLL